MTLWALLNNNLHEIGKIRKYWEFWHTDVVLGRVIRGRDATCFNEERASDFASRWLCQSWEPLLNQDRGHCQLRFSALTKVNYCRKSSFKSRTVWLGSVTVWPIVLGSAKIS